MNTFMLLLSLLLPGTVNQAAQTIPPIAGIPVPAPVTLDYPATFLPLTYTDYSAGFPVQKPTNLVYYETLFPKAAPASNPNAPVYLWVPQSVTNTLMLGTAPNQTPYYTRAIQGYWIIETSTSLPLATVLPTNVPAAPTP